MRSVSPEQVAKAKQIDLLTYMRTYEPKELVKVGTHEYRTRTHDSLRISENGLWNWCSQGVGGKNALNYLIRVKGMDFVSAVRWLCDTDPDLFVSQPVAQKSERFEPVRQFALPVLDQSAAAAANYLRGRCIDERVLRYCFRLGIVGQITNKGYKNCLFIGKDKDGVPRSASIRGCGGTFRGSITGSNKQFGFHIPAAVPDAATVEIFEAPIDAMSRASLRAMSDRDFRCVHYLALDGLNYMAADRFLNEHPEISTVRLCLDNDQPGREFTIKLSKHLAQSGITVEDVPPPCGKDYNDSLVAFCARHKDRAAAR